MSLDSLRLVGIWDQIARANELQIALQILRKCKENREILTRSSRYRARSWARPKRAPVDGADVSRHHLGTSAAVDELQSGDLTARLRLVKRTAGTRDRAQPAIQQQHRFPAPHTTCTTPRLTAQPDAQHQKP